MNGAVRSMMMRILQDKIGRCAGSASVSVYIDELAGFVLFAVTFFH